jgi:hypothetical protein
LTTISREALYDLVWTEPVRTIAQRMGVSDVWLKKCCAGLGERGLSRRWRAVAARVDQSLGKVGFVRDLGSAHSLIRHLLDEDALRRLKPSDAPYRLRYSEPLFDSPFERRRLRILNNLFLALTKAGHQPWLGEQARNVGVTVGSQKISFTLEPGRSPTDESKHRTKLTKPCGSRSQPPGIPGQMMTADASRIALEKLS